MVLLLMSAGSGCWLSKSSGPWEGCVPGINGTNGRVEIVHRSDPGISRRNSPASSALLWNCQRFEPSARVFMKKTLQFMKCNAMNCGV
jgi:hypothetical protein